MRVIIPKEVTDEILTSDVPENDAPVWDSGSNYNESDEVISNHRIYRSAVGSNSGNNPSTDDGTNWVDLGSTNRWRVFDQKLTTKTVAVGSMAYEIVPEVMTDAIALIGIGAASVLVEILDLDDQVVQTRRVNRFQSTGIVDYWTFFTLDISGSEVEDAIFDGLKGYPGNTIRITVEAEDPVAETSLRQIVVGTSRELGWSTSGTSIGFRDFSTKGRDVYGNAVITERAFADTVTFQIALETKKARQTKSILAKQRAKPALYYVSADREDLGTQVYGFFQDFEIPLNSGGISFGNLKVEGLT